MPADVSSELFSTAWQLDRARARSRLVARRPADRLFLRAAADRLVPDGLMGDVTRRLVCDLLPEIECGVLPTWLRPQLQTLAREVFGAEELAQMTDVWQQVQNVDDDDTTTMLMLARRWLDLHQQPGDIATAAGGDPHMGSAMVAEILARIAGDAITQAKVEGLRLTRHQVLADNQAADARDHVHNTECGAGTFGPGRRVQVGFRPPTDDERRLRALVVRRLQRAQYRAPHRTGARVGYPTGRARGNALMQRAAQRAQNVTVTALPWTSQRWQIPPKPPIRAGLVIDLSGSMTNWLPAAGVAIWTLASAVDALGGLAAAAGFAGQVYPLLRPSSQPARVPDLTQRGGSDGCADAIAAVSAGAGLLQPGATALIVLTDGYLPEPDWPAIDRQVQYLYRHKVVVVWALTAARDSRTAVPANTVVLENVAPNAFPLIVADALAAQLTNAGDRPH
ncbi:hypothetical protein [Nocardia sp. NPDC052566]|uniref:hypothetical protein n=1 Tax=Nocardia sp. NPDC052566 TaxID=3364330 RepID=UPI0037C7D554